MSTATEVTSDLDRANDEIRYLNERLAQNRNTICELNHEIKKLKAAEAKRQRQHEQELEILVTEVIDNHMDDEVVELDCEFDDMPGVFTVGKKTLRMLHAVYGLDEQ